MEWKGFMDVEGSSWNNIIPIKNFYLRSILWL